MFRLYFAEWTKFLDGPESREVLNQEPHGWLSPAAQQALHLDEFITDPSAPYYGFKSWNDFFIRQFKPGVRPVAAPDDDDVLVSAAESAPYAIQYQVNASDTFWAKGQPYSLHDMLKGHYVDQFVGGTVYQAFLSAENYHRWHSPVSGTIEDVVQVPGTYYAEAASEGFDPAGPNDSQGYIAHVATRALIFLQADNPKIGLMCVITIGMAEVSSSLVVGANGQKLVKGDKVKKGDQLGYFQFGGSTHCLVFGPQADIDFVSRATPQGENGANSGIVKVNSYLATVR